LKTYGAQKIELGPQSQTAYTSHYKRLDMS